MSDKDWERFPCLRQLYPDGPEEKLKRANENLSRYLDVVIAIHKRREREKYEKMGKKYPLDDYLR